MIIKDIKIEYRSNPLGLDVAKPRFTWLLESDKSNTAQREYSLVVEKNENIIWSSGAVSSDSSVLVEYDGISLEPCTRYTVGLTVVDNHGEKAEFDTWFETGLLVQSNFKANWITHCYEDSTENCPVYAKKFTPKGKIKSARVYASALGIYMMDLNGVQIGEDYFSPGWTSYKNRIQYQTYDITDLIKNENFIEVNTANGWYAGVFGFDGSKEHYGNRTAIWAQIELAYDDGSKEIVVTDESWKCGTAKTRYAEIYHGEIIDNNRKFIADGNAAIYEYPIDVLVSQECEPVRIIENLEPKEYITTPSGEAVIDFGQNLTGFVGVHIKGVKGQEVVVYHAEVLDKHGNFYTENLRAAKATDKFICNGEGEEVFRPRFTFHGFRYIKVEGIEIEKCKFTACVTHTDMDDTGYFECSNEMVNRLWSNIKWGQRGNFLDIPTDCPQRDERLGWTGDAQVFADTASLIYNTSLFFTKWLRDLKTEQTEEHGVPHVIPNIMSSSDGAAAWGDAATIIPWSLYQSFGDKRILIEQYESMKGWVEYIRSKAGGKHLWQSGHQYGDWVALDIANDFAVNGERVGATDAYLIATAFYAYSTELLIKVADVLGYKEDSLKYNKLYANIVDAFRKEYITENGRLVSETQTGCILALHFNLAQNEHRPRILESLVLNLKKRNNHLSTGFVGTPYICHTLSDNGAHDLAGVIFLKKDYPSWLYCIKMGATTIWERWNSINADGNFDESGMNSFNHYAYGSVGAWMIQKLAGINIIKPGYKVSRIAPMPIKGIDSVKARVKTPYGELSCEWACKEGVMKAKIVIPTNTTAVIEMPGQEKMSVGSGVYNFEYATALDLSILRYSTESTLGEILDNPAALSVLKQFAPDILDNPMIKFALAQSISQLVPMMPDGGSQLFEAAIAAANG